MLLVASGCLLFSLESNSMPSVMLLVEVPKETEPQQEVAEESEAQGKASKSPIESATPGESCTFVLIRSIFQVNTDHYSL